jgi:ubiquitin-protein ligase
MLCVRALSHELSCSTGNPNSKEACIDIIKQHNITNPTNCIELIEYTDNDSLVIIIILIRNIKIKIITNFYTFCQANIIEIGKTTYIFNVNNFMLRIIYTNKNFTDIIHKLIHNINQPTKKPVLCDVFHFNSKQFTKTPDINWEQLKAKLSKFKIVNIKPKEKIVIPPDLVGLIKNNIETIINNIRTVNENSTHQHIIMPSEPLNHFIIKIKLSDNYKDIYEKYGEYIEFKLIVNEQVYPIEPPKLEYIGTIPLTMQLLLTLENLSILTKSKWSTLMTFDYLIIKLAEQIESYLRSHIDENEDKTYKEYKEYNTKLYSTILNCQLLPLHIELPARLVRSSILPTGIGYVSSGVSGMSEWDWKRHEEKQMEKLKNTISYLQAIETIIDKIGDLYVNESPLMMIIITYINEFAILEYETKKDLYTVIFQCLLKLINKNISQDNINIINKKLHIILKEISHKDIKDKFAIHHNYITQLLVLYNSDQTTSKDIEHTCMTCEEAYIKQMIYLTDKYNTITIDINSHYYKNKSYNEPTNYIPKTLQRILKEIKSVQGLELPKDPLIHYLYDESKIKYGTFIIAGPVDTPYENGLFHFDIYYPPEFPNVPPNVLLKTTGGGSVRFNPNLYACGKVCLSLLGTWSGPGWDPVHSSLLQILLSISALIFIEKPYFNEPGYERDLNTANGQILSKTYNEKLMPSTIEWGMIDMIKNPPSGYEEIIKTHFKYKGNTIIETINKWINDCVNKDMQQKIESSRNRLMELLETL